MGAGQERQPGAGREPQPGAGREPQPEAGREPQPEAGREPQPEAGREPQPEAGRERRPGADRDRRARALARLAELADEPGGEQFLDRMGVLGDWIVDFAFGDVHTRPGLSPRDRELIIVAVLTSLGSSDPQVRAHIRALRAIEVPWSEIEETILQTTPYAGIPRAVNAIKVLREEQEAAE